VHGLASRALAVHWWRVDDVLKQTGDLSGRVIVTCSLPMNADDTKLAVAHTSSGAETLARKLRKADVVSAFSTVPSEVLFGVFDGKRRRRRPALEAGHAVVATGRNSDAGTSRRRSHSIDVRRDAYRRTSIRIAPSAFEFCVRTVSDTPRNPSHTSSFTGTGRRI